MIEYEAQDTSPAQAARSIIMADDLTAKTCVPCRGGIPPLTEDEAKGLAKQTPDWQLAPKAHHISRKFTFPDFKTALSFVDKVGALAEDEGHHPDLEFGWGYCTIKTFTHKIDGLHENDFILAAKIDKLPR
jgi:4a-hydroxytetrahydrobiopterin dehydratase